MDDLNEQNTQRQEWEAQLLNEDEDARYDAAAHIMKEEPPALSVVTQWTKDTRPLLREMACYFLGASSTEHKLYYPDSVPILMPLLEDEEQEVRGSTAIAIGHHQNLETIPALIRCATDTSEDVRHDAAFALGEFYESTWEKIGTKYKPDVEAALLRLMDDEDEDVRDWATFGIHQGGHDTPRTRARLWKALDDPNPDVRGEAAEALSIFDDRTLIPRLDTLLREDDDLSPLYFLAAEKFGDPALLPAVLVGAEHWREQMKDGKLHSCIISAMDVLESLLKRDEG